MDIVFGWLLIGLVILGPLLLWFLIFRRIGRGTRAKREIRALGNTLTQEQAEAFDRNVLPRASNIFEQRELLIQYIRKLNDESVSDSR